MIQRTISTGLGALTPAAWADIVAAVDATVGIQESTGSASGREIGAPRFVLAKITTAQQEIGKAVWHYDWAQVRRASSGVAFAVIANGLTSATNGGKKAINRLEAGNTAALAYGFVVTTGINLTAHSGYTFQRVPADTVVQLSIRRNAAGVTSFEFEAPNRIDGACSGSGLVENFAYAFGTFPSPSAVALDFGTFLSPINQADMGVFDAPPS